MRLVFYFISVMCSFSCFASCEEYEKVCVSGTQTRKVEGTDVRRDCWQYKYKLDCKKKSKDNCSQIDPNICTYVGEKCVDYLKPEDGGVDANICSNWILSYSCEKEIEYQQEKMELRKNDQRLSDKELLCASMCIDGNCDKVKKAKIEENNELAQGIGFLNALKDAKREQYVGGDIINIFKGEAKACSRHPVNFMNCCRDNPRGWGEAIKLGKCSQDELQIAILKSKKQCVDVGEYCKVKFLGKCIDKRHSYCCYDSCVARILIESAKRQLNRSFGTPENPDCSGISLAELEKVDLSKVDFSDFYEHVVIPSIKLPDLKNDERINKEAAKNIDAASNLPTDKKGFNPSTLEKVGE